MKGREQWKTEVVKAVWQRNTRRFWNFQAAFQSGSSVRRYAYREKLLFMDFHVTGESPIEQEVAEYILLNF